MALRIAFDLDGVLADMDGELARQAETLFGTRVAPRPRAGPDLADTAPAPSQEPMVDTPPESSGAPMDEPADDLALTMRQRRRLWRHVEAIDGFWESLKELEPGAVARLGSLAASRRWEVIFLTKRPDGAGATAQVQSQRWLEARGFTLPSVYVVQGSRGRIAAALGLDIVVDDRPENCLDVVADSRARAILVWREAEHAIPAVARRLGIGVVKSVGECLDVLTQIDAASARPGIVDRMRKLLGLKKEPAGVQDAS